MGFISKKNKSREEIYLHIESKIDELFEKEMRELNNIASAVENVEENSAEAYIKAGIKVFCINNNPVEFIYNGKKISRQEADAVVAQN